LPQILHDSTFFYRIMSIAAFMPASRHSGRDCELLSTIMVSSV